MSGWFGCSTRCLHSGNGIAMELVHWVNYTSPETWVDPHMNSMSIHDSLFSLESPSITLIEKAPFSHVDGASAASSVGTGLGSPKKQPHVSRTLPVPKFTPPKPTFKLTSSLCSVLLPHICFLLCLVPTGSSAVMGYLALKTLSPKNLLEQLKYSTGTPSQQTTCFCLFCSSSLVLLCAFRKELFVSSVLTVAVKLHPYITQLAWQILVLEMSWP